MYSIQLTAIAGEALKKIDSRTRSQILAKIEHLKEGPLLLGKALTGPLKEFRSVREAGQLYRIIYKVLKDKIIVIVIAVGIRKSGDNKDIYELMKKIHKSRNTGKRQLTNLTRTFSDGPVSCFKRYHEPFLKIAGYLQDGLREYLEYIILRIDRSGFFRQDGLKTAEGR